MNNNEYELYLGDALEILQTIEKESIDLIVTSPPYADSRTNTCGGIKPDEYNEMVSSHNTRTFKNSKTHWNIHFEYQRKSS